MDSKIITRAAFGFLSGIGLDEVMKQVSIQIPDLQQSSGIPIPGYDPAGIHYDDLLVLIGSLGIAGYGAVKKDYGWVAMGLTMAMGSYIASVLFTPVVASTPPTVAVATPAWVGKGVYVD